MAITFKSVGELSTDRKFTTTPVQNPIGIKTPLALGEDADGIFSMHFKLEDQIQDNFRNLLLTNNGERLGLFDFGANLRALTLELAPDDFEAEAMNRIKRATSKYMPFIDLQSFAYTIDRNDNQNTAKIKLRVLYNVPSAGITSKGMELTFYLGG